MWDRHCLGLVCRVTGILPEDRLALWCGTGILPVEFNRRDADPTQILASRKRRDFN
jgi:hypothetical protein